MFEIESSAKTKPKGWPKLKKKHALTPIHGLEKREEVSFGFLAVAFCDGDVSVFVATAAATEYSIQQSIFVFLSLAAIIKLQAPGRIDPIIAATAIEGKPSNLPGRSGIIMTGAFSKFSAKYWAELATLSCCANRDGSSPLYAVATFPSI